MSFVLRLFLSLSCAGLSFGLTTHLVALSGLPLPWHSASRWLGIGIFVVWIPAILVSQSLTGDFKKGDFWKAALRGCPAWMRMLVWGFFGYAVINFLLVFLPSSVFDGPPSGEAEQFRVLSGHLMVFYAVAAAILYSSLTVRRHDATRRCPGGHPASPSAIHCEVCGARIADRPGNAEPNART